MTDCAKWWGYHSNVSTCQYMSVWWEIGMALPYSIWPVDKALNSWERKPGFKSYAAVSNVGQGRSLYKCCPGSLSCINECLPINSGVYLYTNSPRTLTAVWLDVSHRCRDGAQLNIQVCQGKCTSFWVIRIGYFAIKELTVLLHDWFCYSWLHSSLNGVETTSVMRSYLRMHCYITGHQETLNKQIWRYVVCYKISCLFCVIWLYEKSKHDIHWSASFFFPNQIGNIFHFLLSDLSLMYPIDEWMQGFMQDKIIASHTF